MLLRNLSNCYFQSKNTECAEMLIASCTNVNDADFNTKTTPLHLAAASGDQYYKTFFCITPEYTLSRMDTQSGWTDHT